MSVLKSIRRWLALVLRPGEPGPEHHDLNVQQHNNCVPPQSEDHFNPYREQQLQELERLNRRHQDRSGPWQQK